ncbi:MAG TPA: hypothetical protein VH083_18390 [Myxococcales bacterium]|nr:hypothetical protein [Myxococcales bacterium]
MAEPLAEFIPELAEDDMPDMPASAIEPIEEPIPDAVPLIDDMPASAIEPMLEPALFIEDMPASAIAMPPSPAMSEAELMVEEEVWLQPAITAMSAAPASEIFIISPERIGKPFRKGNFVNWPAQ